MAIRIAPLPEARGCGDRGDLPQDPAVTEDGNEGADERVPRNGRRADGW
jgi:hypothetical protein